MSIPSSDPRTHAKKVLDKIDEMLETGGSTTSLRIALRTAQPSLKDFIDRHPSQGNEKVFADAYPRIFHTADRKENQQVISAVRTVVKWLNQQRTR